MKLRTKIVSIFIFALIISIGVIFFGMTDVLDKLSYRMLQKQAEGSTLFLQHTIIASNPSGKAFSAQEAVQKIDLFKHVSDQSKSYEVSKVLLVNKNFNVLASFPADETGANHAMDPDIKETFASKKMTTVIEVSTDNLGVKIPYIDVVTYFTLDDGTPLVLEVKLDFAKTNILLENQYTTIETNAILFSLTLLSILLGVLLILITRTAIRPVVQITKAMEDAGSGNLDVMLVEGGRDEFGTLAHEFNRMVEGIREKLKLSQYVSKSTQDAVKDSMRDNRAHVPIRRSLVLFFSDIRGFTSFAEERDPELVINLLNRILAIQANIIKRHGGDVDKFVGDEVMATFEDANSASEAALEIQAEMKTKIQELQGLQIGIGIHEGSVMQGDVGSEDVKNFTVIGNVVNTAARLQSVAGPGEILISIEVLNHILKAGSWATQPKGSLSLKGKTVSISTFQLTGKWVL
jgi:class 3 adenylate cyclase